MIILPSFQRNDLCKLQHKAFRWNAIPFIISFYLQNVPLEHLPNNYGAGTTTGFTPNNYLAAVSTNRYNRSGNFKFGLLHKKPRLLNNRGY
jgi:hypothetical protein